ncbi:asparagine synthase-domain-containing protein [Yarrowia lipolytica]|uniref:Asparagine synthase-domain-containing protein n=1 Tax=Yarrowia lipolytica TaxID=4952 RepID=A0A371CBX7_YARLL|nr:asparagine synthase-domain-containing protein [Yarrowia lipolytica]RDW40985.1 asparagine synthase-domain-containing protein [Yarrowia lipolytica]
MCGILCWKGTIDDELLNRVKSRGSTCFDTRVSSSQVHCLSSVLSLRPPLTPQPVVKNDKIVMYNGELYNIGEGCDTVAFSEALFNTPSVISALQNIKGEYAFAFVDGNTIWFGRDCIGRRSLVYRIDGENFVISSVTDHVMDTEEQGWIQCVGGVVYELDVVTVSISEHLWGYKDDETNPNLIYPYREVSNDVIELENHVISEYATQFKQLLADALSVRTVGYEQISILFSGGIDCALLARLADINLPPSVSIQLVNVAFQNPRVGEEYETPDRVLGRNTFEELKALSQYGRMIFSEVNVPYEETLSHRETVQSLMYPSTSVMDLSIAVAFYFASKACSSNVVISGLGADELFGGYSRIVQSLTRGYDAVAESLQVEFSRLHVRNLGRDDRVICHHGKEARYPFLDEDVVAWATACPVNLKLSGSRDEDTKFLLREVARSVGLDSVTFQKKRAIQFGARSAKMEIGSGKVKGHEVFK